MSEINFSEFFYYNKETGNLHHIRSRSKGKKDAIAGYPHARGYITVRCNGKGFLAHRVVWYMHYGRWPENQINHKNGIKTDNRIENLEDVTNLENRHHAVKNGLQAKGERSNSKITEFDVGIIKNLRARGMMIKDIALFYDVHRATIALILKDKIWKHIKYKPSDSYINHHHDDIKKRIDKNKKTFGFHLKSKTHCPQGHEYSEDNTVIYKGSRRCKECRRETWKRCRNKKRKI